MGEFWGFCFFLFLFFFLRLNGRLAVAHSAKNLLFRRPVLLREFSVVLAYDGDDSKGEDLADDVTDEVVKERDI